MTSTETSIIEKKLSGNLSQEFGNFSEISIKPDDPCNR